MLKCSRRSAWGCPRRSSGTPSSPSKRVSRTNSPGPISNGTSTTAAYATPSATPSRSTWSCSPHTTTSHTRTPISSQGRSRASQSPHKPSSSTHSPSRGKSTNPSRANCYNPKGLAPPSPEKCSHSVRTSTPTTRYVNIPTPSLQAPPGLANWTLTYPLDVVRTRIIAQRIGIREALLQETILERIPRRRRASHDRQRRKLHRVRKSAEY